MADNRAGTSNATIPSSAASSTSGSYIPDFQTQTQYQIMHLQRLVAELRATHAKEKEQIEIFTREMAELKEKIRNIERKLTNLQKVVAGQADSNKVLQKDVIDKDNDNKGRNEALKIELVSLKQRMEDKATRLEELRRSGVGGAPAAVSIPENIAQMFEALERQLGMYDVRIAENDVRFQVLETTNYDGKLIWKIMDFTRRREDARRGKALSIYSQPFYTSKYGYKMCLRIYLNGDGMGKNTHISLFFVLMKGENDALLPFPFRQKVTLMLLDQGPDRRHMSDVFRPDPTSSSFKRPTSDMNIASGCPMFVPHETINGSSYVKDETIFIRVTVETSDLENY